MPVHFNDSFHSKQHGVIIVRCVGDTLVHDKVLPKVYVKDVFGQLIELSPCEAECFIEELLKYTRRAPQDSAAYLCDIFSKFLDNKLPRRRYPFLFDIQDIDAEEI